MGGCTGGDWTGASTGEPEKLISCARGVPALSETALLAFNLVLDTVARSREGFKARHRFAGCFFFGYHPVFGQLLV